MTKDIDDFEELFEYVKSLLIEKYWNGAYDDPNDGIMIWGDGYAIQVLVPRYIIWDTEVSEILDGFQLMCKLNKPVHVADLARDKLSVEPCAVYDPNDHGHEWNSPEKKQ